MPESREAEIIAFRSKEKIDPNDNDCLALSECHDAVNRVLKPLCPSLGWED